MFYYTVILCGAFLTGFLLGDMTGFVDGMTVANDFHTGITSR